MSTVLVIHWRWVWEKTRPFVLAGLWFFLGWISFHQQMEYLAESRVLRAQQRWEMAADAHVGCEAHLSRVLTWMGFRHEGEQPQWLEQWLEGS